MTNPVLGRRALNRALLHRQLLLERSSTLTAAQAIDHLVGMQSQAPGAPYIGLWTRLADFAFDDVAGLMESRAAVRLTLMRGTVHLVGAADALLLRPVVQPALEKGFRHSQFAAGVPGVDRDELVAAGRKLLAERPRGPAELRDELGPRWPAADPASLVHALRCWAPLVQLPPRGVWGRSGGPVYSTVEDWLGHPQTEPPAPEPVLLRYLAAFGPASVADMQKWSGLTGLREVVARLGPELRTFQDEHGRVLYDVQDGPLPDPDTPAPARFVAEFDNLLLSHADRTRVLAEEHRTRVITVNGLVRGTILLDGFVAGTWTIERERGATTVRVAPFARLARADREALSAEGTALAAAAGGEGRTEFSLSGD
ncbi:winged helix DNA-binding domain-containing protein [Streptomyces sp. H27-D2]|uniref:winged helix DNA-binding domain-containing protein n=1 Tax=Streptomyces sp. H27-D2 TaxID=3046304 RepID=UPI002DBFB740|nr:winged helix DNA-binding domain-containing protein [Streptomyces sp. H27-D2]MEC4019921.1 winged helix DNA-binding domain-containing protein [Streptomyces sp. H27-D2]